MFLQRYVKRPLHLTPDSPPQQKGPNKRPLYVNNSELPIFQAPCLCLGAVFPLSLINPTLSADLVVSQVNLLPHEPIFFGPWRQELSMLAHNISGGHEGTPLLDQGRYD
jgi:hypothetical protein